MLGKGIEGLIFSVPVFQDHSCSPCSFILGAPHCVLRKLCASWCNLRRQYKLAWMSNLFHMRPNSRKMYMIPNFLTVTFKHSAIQDGCSLALYTSASRPPHQPLPTRSGPASPTPYSFDWPSYILAPGPLFLSKGQWGVVPTSGFPGNWWVKLM